MSEMKSALVPTPVTKGTSEITQGDHSSLWRDAFERLTANRLAIMGMAIVIILLLVAIFGPLITPYDYLSQDISIRNQPPSLIHLLGTDDLGRDALSRIIYGARTATVVSFSVVGVSLIIGMILGSIAGYSGGKVDAIIVWFIDVIRSIPGILLAVVINTSLKPPISGWMDDMYLATHNPFFRQSMWVDLVLVFGALAFIQWPSYARLARGQILSIRNKEYVLAARALGIPTYIILLHYVIPNVLGPIIVEMSAGLGTAMVLESAFSFLGVGVRPPVASWGNMISEGLRVWRNFPHLLVAPAAVLGIVSVAFSFLGDGLNDALNPRHWK